MSKKTGLPRCRFCGSELQHTFVDLGMQPLCESYLSPDQSNQIVGKFIVPIPEVKTYAASCSETCSVA